jgi:hypothetical protein
MEFGFLLAGSQTVWLGEQAVFSGLAVLLGI